MDRSADGSLAVRRNHAHALAGARAAICRRARRGGLDCGEGYDLGELLTALGQWDPSDEARQLALLEYARRAMLPSARGALARCGANAREEDHACQELGRLWAEAVGPVLRDLRDRRDRLAAASEDDRPQRGRDEEDSE